MQQHRHLVQADRLDRHVERDLVAVDDETAVGHERGKVARRNRAIELSGFRRLADHHEALPVELGADLVGLGLGHEVARLQIDLHGLKLGLVGLRRTQRLAFRQQIVAGIAVLHAHHLAHLAEVGDAFEQNHFHCLSPVSGLRIGWAAPAGDAAAQVEGGVGEAEQGHEQHRPAEQHGDIGAAERRRAGCSCRA